MRELRPIYFKTHMDSRYNCGFSYNMHELSSIISRNKDAKGIVITWPNYYGICADLEFVVSEAHKYGMKVLVDCAHGAHFGVIEELPENPIKLGCDMVVMSCHKTLSSFTQTAYLHVGKNVNIEKVDFYVSAFMTTSPSYMMMMSMEYGWFYLKKYGYKKYKDFFSLCAKYRHKINNINGFHVIGQEDMYNGKDQYLSTKVDGTRFVINLDKEYSGHKLLEYLRKNKIQAEMSDGRNVILIPSPFNEESDFEYLYETLLQCDLTILKENYVPELKYNFGIKVLEPYEVTHKSFENVCYKLCEGMVSAENIVPYPPGIPLIVQGEVIDIDVINVIKYYLKNGLTVLGVNEENIRIVKP